MFRASTETFQLSETWSVNLAEDSEGERMYRLELMLVSGQVVPLRGGYWIGRRLKERLARQLQAKIEGR
jgi:hypothetical protein